MGYRNPHARRRHFVAATTDDVTARRQPRPAPRRTATRAAIVAAAIREDA